MEEPSGGEVSCYLSQVDETGVIPDPRRHIMLLADADASALPVRLTDDAYSALQPLDGESAEAYHARLEEPEARTAAWRVVLLADEQPVGLDVGTERDDPRVRLLLEYVQGLME